VAIIVAQSLVKAKYQALTLTNRVPKCVVYVHYILGSTALIGYSGLGWASVAYSTSTLSLRISGGRSVLSGFLYVAISSCIECSLLLLRREVYTSNLNTNTTRSPHRKPITRGRNDPDSRARHDPDSRRKRASFSKQNGEVEMKMEMKIGPTTTTGHSDTRNVFLPSITANTNGYSDTRNVFFPSLTATNEKIDAKDDALGSPKQDAPLSPGNREAQKPPRSLLKHKDEMDEDNTHTITGSNRNTSATHAQFNASKRRVALRKHENEHAERRRATLRKLCFLIYTLPVIGTIAILGVLLNVHYEFSADETLRDKFDRLSTNYEKNIDAQLYVRILEVLFLQYYAYTEPPKWLSTCSLCHSLSKFYSKFF